MISPPVLPPRGGTALGNTHFNEAGANCLRAGLLLFRRQEPPGKVSAFHPCPDLACKAETEEGGDSLY